MRHLVNENVIKVQLNGKTVPDCPVQGRLSLGRRRQPRVGVKAS